MACSFLGSMGTVLMLHLFEAKEPSPCFPQCFLLPLKVLRIICKMMGYRDIFILVKFLKGCDCCMLKIWNIEKIIDDTLAQHNLTMINYEFNNKLTVPMSFNVSTNTIKFDYLQVNGYISKIRIKESDEDFVRLILYHVIGYYLDFKKNKHDLRTLMYGEDDEIEKLKAEIERNAWEFGRTLVPKRLLESYDKVRELDKTLIKGQLTNL
jgi:hypothetical protein